MKKLLPKWFVILLLFSKAALCAQDLSSIQDDKYGLDPLLYNGKYYTYFVSSSTKGSPFFNSDDYIVGSAELHGLIYRNIELNFDVFNQQLVLRFVAEDNGIRHIIISDAWLEAFTLEKKRFEVLPETDSTRHVYQVIGTGPIRILYAWSKELKLDTKPGTRSFFFTPLFKKSFLEIKNQHQKYSNNKSFVALLNQGMQARVKKYLNQKKINVKKASDDIMYDLVTYLNTPLHK